MGSAMKSNQSTISGGGAAGPSGGTAGLGRSGLGTSGGQRLPASPRERKPALAALAVLLILGGALASAYLVMASGERVSAIRIAQPVAAGQRIPAGALEEVQVGDTGIQYIKWSERAKVTRYFAAVPLVRGALLTNSMISPSDAPAKGRLVVGLALKPGQLPSGGLTSGKHVTLFAVGGATNGGPRAGTVLAQDAIVLGVGTGDSGGPTRLRSEQTSVDVAVLPADAAKVTQAASAGAVALALIPDGTSVSAPPAPQQPAGQNDEGVDPVPSGGPGTGGGQTGGPQVPSTGGN
ncbi:hypothetical protein [Actinomadura madurae]|uniref:hypothetical protein n=1 Tax=Actinomadura madurae TaxID=1993 RepID=UPI0020266427|nr:hypothetical protein [Actinomadura madurae]MCP9950640.1 hypothetical protein [Actinomadura madurae]MCP9967418.1 hypothetical protein [Actinomadura madurae]MCP9979876.1 hypothetical protein [Actinomadura madurae]MCQ0008598.1 hypothetical protein [Actinomadura madurae]MCQ0016082.1 hypothetical protein [Actinomadura madurae]